MTPAALRALAEEATPEVMSEIADSTGASGEAWHQLARLAPDLALLCAEMGEVLKDVMPSLSFYIGPNARTASSRESVQKFERCRAALAKLEALEAR